jgi:hypothetical protein
MLAARNPNTFRVQTKIFAAVYHLRQRAHVKYDFDIRSIHVGGKTPQYALFSCAVPEMTGTARYYASRKSYIVPFAVIVAPLDRSYELDSPILFH